MPPTTWTPGVIDKPSSCKGCPFYQDGKGFVPDEIQPDTQLFILMQNPGKDEEQVGCPAVGKTGQWMDKDFIPLTGLARGQGVSVGNVIKCRVGGTNHLPSGDDLYRAIAHCTSRHLRLPRETRLVLTQGKVAFEYATRFQNRALYKPNGKPATVTDWRGYFLLPEYGGGVQQASIENPGAAISSYPTMVTLHIADLFRDSKMSWVSELDWRKVGTYLRTGSLYHAHPRQYVSTAGATDPGEQEWWAWAHGAEFISLDTEYIPAPAPRAGTLTILGLSAYLHGEQRTLQYDTHGSTPRQLRDLLLRLANTKPIVFHNALADLLILEENLGITYDEFFTIEDTMLAHAVLWSELPHDLEFLGSIYGEYGKFKHLRISDELLYNAGDCIDTASVWQALQQGFKSDKAAERVYREQSLRLLPVLLKAYRQGIRVNKKRVLEVWNEYLPLIQEVNRLVELSVGYPLNLNSGAELKHYLYTECGYPLQLDRETKRPSSNDDAIATLRRTVSLPFDPDKEITLSTDDETHYSVYGRIASGCDPILECRVLYNELWHVVNNYLLGICKGVYGETKAKRKKGRASLWRAGQILGTDIVDRVYPNFGIHAQKTGRWSTTDPPLAQLPSDLRDIVCPDPGTCWISWDWSAIEPRLLQALTGSRLLKRVFDDSLDLHTYTVCYMFNWEFPPNLVDPHGAPECEGWRKKYNWKGGEDPRRVFAKTGRYEMYYGGVGSNAAYSAAQFGLEPRQLKAALAKLPTSDPDYYTWRLRMEETIRRTSLIRTFKGRPRRFLSKGHSKVREGINQPMQGGVSDIFNETIVLLDSQYKQLDWMWGMHDSQKWQIALPEATLEVLQAIKVVVERPHDVHGTMVMFPCKMEVILPPELGSLVLKEKDWYTLKEMIHENRESDRPRDCSAQHDYAYPK